MPSRAPPDLAALRHAYEETDKPAARIGAAAGLGKAEIYRLARRHGWRRKHPRPFPGKAGAPGASDPSSGADEATAAAPPRAASPESPPPSGSRRRPAPTSTGTRRRLLDRMVAAISLKLEQLERRMTQDLDQGADDGATATDHERETRAIGALIDNLGKVTEIEGGLTRPAGGKSATATADLAGEADRFRRELAERLRKIVGAAAGRT